MIFFVIRNVIYRGIVVLDDLVFWGCGLFSKVLCRGFIFGG